MIHRRGEIRATMVADPQHGENMIRGCNWDEILIASVKSAQNKVCEGKSLQQIAEMRQRSCWKVSSTCFWMRSARWR